MKKHLLLIGLCTIVLFGCSNSDEELASSTSVSSEVAAVLVDDVKQEDIDKIQSALEEGFSSFSNVSYSNETRTFHLTPKDGVSETDTLIKVANDPNYAEHEKVIKDMASSVVEMSNLIEDNIAKDVSIELDNPNENGESFFIVSNGQIEYPILK